MKLTPKRNADKMTSDRSKYALRGVLEGQLGPVTSIAVHPLGTYVASGGECLILQSPSKIYRVLPSFQGEEGTKIWHLPSAKLLETPAGASDRGYTTAVVWITKPDDAEEGIAFGTDDGYLCIWQRNGVNVSPQ